MHFIRCVSYLDIKTPRLHSTHADTHVSVRMCTLCVCLHDIKLRNSGGDFSNEGAISTQVKPGDFSNLDMIS